ncbi:MAG: DPP IV N-terminal domain-containing protein [Porphyromonas sp.]|nr:DPP IV N-terminal domain-containing protein [Porphyromonas sp.]
MMKSIKSSWLSIFVSILIAGTHVATPGVVAQERHFTLEEVTPGSDAFYRLLPETPRVAGVTHEGVLLWGDEGVMLQGIKGEAVPYLSPSDLKAITSEGGVGGVAFRDNGRLAIQSSGNRVTVVDRVAKEVVARYELPSVGSDYRLSPMGDYLVVLTDYKIRVLTSEGESIEIAEDASLDIVYGQPAHREEFGISDGVFFSPSGDKFAFYRIDQSQVTPYPIVHVGDPIAQHAPIKYPMAGQASQAVTVGICDVRSGEVYYLKSGLPTDRYFTNIAWSPEGDFIYVDEVLRSQKETNLVKYEVATGAPVATLVTERNEKYIEPSTPNDFVPRGKGNFLRVSRVDGFNHLYLYSAEGRLLRQLTSGSWEIKRYLGMDVNGLYAYFLSNKDHTIGQDLYRVALRDGQLTRLTGGDGWYDAFLSDGAEMAFVSFSNKETPSKTFLYSLGKKIKQRQLSEASDPLSDFARPVVELGELRAASGDLLHYKLTRPAELEPGKRYPVIVYVYGGPHSQLVTDSWRSLQLTWDTYMAGEEGYIVFTLDNRGTSNRGMAFESATHRQLGKVEMEDQMVGVEYLKSLPYVDAERIGVYGWSFGGFMATNLMLSHPETFKVGVAGGPVMNWAYYEIMYGERYMETPASNPEGYRASCLVDRAGDLQGRLLLIHGAVDPVVVWQHSLMFVKASVKARTYPDYMVYPEHEHNVIGNDRVHLHHVITRYFNDFLR